VTHFRSRASDVRRPLSPTGRAAVVYAERFGWLVFPTLPRTKQPYGRFVRNGFKDATRDVAQIHRWWRADPSAGVALSCAMSRIVVIDADLYKDDCEFPALEQRLGALPQTVRQVTPQGGVHYLFRDSVGSYINPCAGAESKYDGYILLAPSVHPNGETYKWDLGAHPLETEIANLPDRWLQHLTTHKARGPVHASSGTDAADSWLGFAFAALGWLGDMHPDGRRNVLCPWVHEHTDGRGNGQDSSSVVFPRVVGATLGGFRCAHGHCAARTWRDVVDVLPVHAKRAADDAMRSERNRLALTRLANMRSAS